MDGERGQPRPGQLLPHRSLRVLAVGGTVLLHQFTPHPVVYYTDRRLGEQQNTHLTENRSAVHDKSCIAAVRRFAVESTEVLAAIRPNKTEHLF